MNPKSAGKTPAKPQMKPNKLPYIVKHTISQADDDDDCSSVCSNGSHDRRLAAAATEEEFRLREELKEEIERELEQEILDGISDLVRRLSELKARQFARRFGKKTENEIGRATRQWLRWSFGRREWGVRVCGGGECGSCCSDAESATGRRLKSAGRPELRRELWKGGRRGYGFGPLD